MNSLNNPDCSSFLDGLGNSFKLLLESDTLCIDSHANDNYSSATCDEFKPQMDQLFLNELALGRISHVTSKPKCTHPIGSIPKKDSGKSCPIMDCSGPPGRSVNDDIKKDLESFRMNLIDTTVSVSTDNCFYAIVDTKSAWRWVPVLPPHHELQGFRMTLLATSTLLIIDSVICAPAIFNRLSNAVVCMIVPRGSHSIVNYLDNSSSLAKQKLNVNKVSWLLLDCFIHLDLMSIGKELSLHVNALLS